MSIDSTVEPSPLSAHPTTRWGSAAPDSAASPRSRCIVGLALASPYGLALGARTGGLDLVWHALGVSGGLALASLVTVPSLLVFLALFDVPLEARQIFDSTSQGIASAGAVLAGITPAMALLVVTVESLGAVRTLAWGGLLLGGSLGLANALAALRRPLHSAHPKIRSRFVLAATGFALLTVALAGRAWSGLLPLMGGAS